MNILKNVESGNKVMVIEATYRRTSTIETCMVLTRVVRM